MNLSKEIKFNGKVIAYAFDPSQFSEQGKTNFFGENKDFLQVGIHNKEKASNIAPHYNNSKQVILDTYQEFIYVVTGKVKISFFSIKSKKLISQLIVDEGEAVVLLDQAHSFEFLEETQLIEVKQGPFFDKSSIKLYDTSQ